MNCGRKAAKNPIDFGFSNVTIALSLNAEKCDFPIEVEILLGAFLAVKIILKPIHTR